MIAGVVVGDDKMIVFLPMSSTGLSAVGTWERLDWWTELCVTSVALNESVF